MALSGGTRIRPSEILQFTGAGGMGEVYRARDTRLNRDVAVKIMAAALTFSPRLGATPPRELFSADMADGLHTMDVSRDGRFLIVMQPREKPATPRLTVVTDWQARLGR